MIGSAEGAAFAADTILTGTIFALFGGFFHAYSMDTAMPNCFAAAAIVKPRLRNAAANCRAFAFIPPGYRRLPWPPSPRQTKTSFRNASISLSMSTSMRMKVPRFTAYVRRGPGEVLLWTGPIGTPRSSAGIWGRPLRSSSWSRVRDCSWGA